MSFLVAKVGGAVAGDSADAVLELASEHVVLVVHGAGPQISAEMERRGIPIEFVDGRRVTSYAALEIVRESLEAVNASLCEAIGERAVPFFGYEVGLQGEPIPDLGLAGEVKPQQLPAVERVLATGKIAVLAPLAAGPGSALLNVNADDAAAAIAVGMQAHELRFLTDVEGLLLDGAVVEQIDVDAAGGLLAGGTLEGGIIPKLSAAVTAARGGVAASIGRTVVAA
jgi:acetylglutamate kinase